MIHLCAAQKAMTEASAAIDPATGQPILELIYCGEATGPGGVAMDDPARGWTDSSRVPWRYFPNPGLAKKDEEFRNPLWAIALNECKNARDAWDDVQKHRTNLGPWISTMSKEIDDVSAALLSSELFWDAIDKTWALLEAGDLPGAREKLGTKLQNPQIVVTQQQGEAQTQLYTLIDNTEYEKIVETQTSAIRDAINNGDYRLAGDDWNQLNKFLGDKRGQKIPKSVHTAHEVDVTSLRNVISKGGSYEKEMKEADQAHEDKDYPTELGHLQNACRLRPTPELDARIKTLQSQIALDAAKDLIKDGKLAEAKEQLNESLKYKETQEAKDLLTKMAKTEEYQAILHDADAAFKRGEFKKAADGYEKAQEIDPSDDEVRSRLNLSKYEIAFAQRSAGQGRQVRPGRKALPRVRETPAGQGLGHRHDHRGNAPEPRLREDDGGGAEGHAGQAVEPRPGTPQQRPEDQGRRDG